MRVALAVDPRVRIALRGMRIVAAFSPWKSREPSFVRKLFMLSRASIGVPSTEKCSCDSGVLTRFRNRRAEKNARSGLPDGTRFSSDT